jgi:hypothetical protein
MMPVVKDTSGEIDPNQLADGEDVLATRAPTAEAELAAHQIAALAASFTQVSLLAPAAHVDGLLDQFSATAEPACEVGHQLGLAGFVMAEPVGPVSAGWAAEATPAARLEVLATDRAGGVGAGIVAAIVAYGDGAHPAVCWALPVEPTILSCSLWSCMMPTV